MAIVWQHWKQKACEQAAFNLIDDTKLARASLVAADTDALKQNYSRFFLLLSAPKNTANKAHEVCVCC